MGALLSTIPTPAAFVAALLLFHLLFTGLGLGATLILIPKRLSRYVLIFAPVFGFAVGSWLGWRSLWLGAAGTKSSAPVIALVASALLVAAFSTRTGRANARDSFAPDVLLALGIAVCGAIALSMPAIVEPHLTTISAGNHDVASYALTERFLMYHHIGDQPGNVTDYFAVASHAQSTVFGVFFCSALAGSLLGLESYQLQSVAIAAFAIWIDLALYVLARETFRFRRSTSLILVAGFSVNELVAYLALHGFKSQFAGMALAGCIYCWMIPMLRRESLPGLREWAGATLLNWGLAVAYPHIVPLVYLPLLAYAVALAIEVRSVGRLRWPALTMGAVFAGLIALSPFMAENVYRYTVVIKNIVGGGWWLMWISPASLLGINAHSAFSHMLWPFEVLFGFVVVGVAVMGLRMARAQDRDVFLVAISILAVVAALYMYLALRGRQDGVLGGYKSFKLASFFEPLLWCSLLLVLREPASSRGAWQKLLAVALVAGNIIAGGRLIKSVSEHHLSVPRQLVDLTSLETDSRVRSIDIVTANFWNDMWETVFLFHKNLYHLHGTYYMPSPLRGEWVLEDRSDRVLRVERCPVDGSIRLNERFTALPRANGVLVADWDRGWQGDERTHRWTSAQRASVRIHSASRERVRIGMAFTSLNAGNRVVLQLNAVQLGDCSANKCQVSATLDRGENLLEIVSALPPERPPNGDPRLLGVAFSELTIAEASCRISSR